MLYYRNFLELFLEVSDESRSLRLDERPLEYFMDRDSFVLFQLSVDVSSKAFCVDLVLLMRDTQISEQLSDILLIEEI